MSEANDTAGVRDMNSLPFPGAYPKTVDAERFIWDSRGMTPAANVRFALELTALGSGVLTLGVEIAAGRVLAPYFGSSLHQWAALIGVVLVAYMAGYGFVGWLCRRGPGWPLAVGGAFAASVPFWAAHALDPLVSVSLAPASVAGAFAVVGVPSVLWASVLPWLQKEGGGARFARLLAWSAAGNLVGAWGTAFLAVPALGTRATFWLLGGWGLALGCYWLLRGRRTALAACAAMAVGLGAGAGAIANRSSVDPRPWRGGSELYDHRIVEIRESPYQRVAVWDQDGRRALALNGALQFLWSQGEPLTSGDRYAYYNFSTAAAMWTANPAVRASKRVLVLGLGGGLIPWQLQRVFGPESPEITSFELDPGVVAVARAWLPLGQTSGVDVRVGDGRQLLRSWQGVFDYILLDTFLNSYVPFHLTTREFFELVRAHLAPGGVLVANFHTVFAESGLLPRLEATIGSVFPSSAAMDLPVGTTLVVSTPDPAADPSAETGAALLAGRVRAAVAHGPVALRRWSAEAATRLRPIPRLSVDEADQLLTDDHNDTEQRLYETRRYVWITSG